MTLDTRVIVNKPLPAKRVFDYCNEVIGGTSAWWEHDGQPEWGNPHYCNRPGQGLPGWLFVFYGPDGPLRRDEDSGKPEGFVEVSLDTAYGYHAANGASCSDLHAWFVRTLGEWLDDQGAPWSWRNEYTGEWFTGTDGLAEFGNAHLGALR